MDGACEYSSYSGNLLGRPRSSAAGSAADTIRQIIASSFNKPRQGVMAHVFGWVVFVVGASNLFVSLQDALNSIWGVEKTKGGRIQVARNRVASAGMIVVIGLILTITFIANGAVANARAYVVGVIDAIDQDLVA